MTHLKTSPVDLVSWVLVILVSLYLAFRTFEKSDDRPGLIRRWLYTAALIFLILLILWVRLPKYPVLMTIKPILTLFPALIIGRMWAPSIGSMLANPLTSAFDGGDEEVEAKPYYFLAEGKRRKGLYQEAIADVRRQLELFPGDYEGYAKLASIQMEDLKNLPAAQAAFNEFLELPGRATNEVVSALHLLADWQLQFNRDATAAAESLQRIVRLFPGTPLAHAAEQRIAHLGSADETSRVRYQSKFTVGPGEKDVGLRKESRSVAASTDPQILAEGYVKQLETHPFDTDAREKLAVLYAEEFHRLDMAADQLEQLIALPAESPKHVARWLNLLATLHIQQAQNLEAAESALHRIIEKFPGGALASVAVSRLASLHSELKAGRTTAPKTLGTYERDVGLKPSNG